MEEQREGCCGWKRPPPHGDGAQLRVGERGGWRWLDYILNLVPASTQSASVSAQSSVPLPEQGHSQHACIRIATDPARLCHASLKRDVFLKDVLIESCRPTFPLLSALHPSSGSPLALAKTSSCKP